MFQTIIHNLEFQINQQQEGHMKDVGRTKKLSSLSTSDSDKFSDYGFNHSWILILCICSILLNFLLSMRNIFLQLIILGVSLNHGIKKTEGIVNHHHQRWRTFHELFQWESQETSDNRRASCLVWPMWSYEPMLQESSNSSDRWVLKTSGYNFGGSGKTCRYEQWQI